MNRSLKSVVALLVLVCLIGAVFAWWGSFGASPKRWLWRAIFTLGALGTITLLVWAECRRDAAPDFLLKVAPSYFERTGFCFSVGTVVRDGACYLQIPFQNRYERPCEAQLVLKAGLDFFLTRKKMQSMALRIDCGPGAFGIAQVPLPVPEKYQGKAAALDVGAAVKYPKGKGKMLRYRDGLEVGPVKFNSTLGQVATLAGLFVGMAITSHPARAKVTLPENVAEHLPDDTPVEIATLWEVGDPQEFDFTF
ncbi:MAG TPA: hypothetical protein VMZ92_11170 [Planctomycetota bacterium]|nr:hypothetical protein [Planctomycetota bacterium]